MKHIRVLIFHTSRRGDPGENRDWQPTQGEGKKKKNTFSDSCEGMCQNWTLYYSPYHVVEGKEAPPCICFFQGGAMAIKFHSWGPSLAEDPKNHKLNARIRKGPAGLDPPSGRFVITLWNRRFAPGGATLSSNSINRSNIWYTATLPTLTKEIQMSALSSDSPDGVIWELLVG